MFFKKKFEGKFEVLPYGDKFIVRYTSRKYGAKSVEFLSTEGDYLWTAIEHIQKHGVFELKSHAENTAQKYIDLQKAMKA